jgi:NSS family neurotransmitter:Na+ symporter
MSEAKSMSQEEHWSGRIGFTLATIGSAVGLGSIWKFPYEVGTNGGSAFVFCYLAGLVIVVLPLMLAEFSIGRRGAADPATALARIAEAHGGSSSWALAGALGVATGFLILSFYAVIGGWTLDYAVGVAILGVPSSSASAQAQFDHLVASPLRMLVSQTLFMTATALIVARGVAKGIEAVCRILMPLLILMIAALAGFSMMTGESATTLRYLFGFDLDRFTVRGALEALGLGFFSIGVGLSLMITYAPYAGREVNLRQAALMTLVGDTLISFLAGMAIFPIVFRAGLDPASGPGLMFISLPIGFARLPFGQLWALAFYILLFIAALASAISLLELVVAWLRQRLSISRIWASAIASAACWVTGFLTVFSFNHLKDWRPLRAVPSLGDANAYEGLDHLTSNLMLPLGGLLIAIFAGWVMPSSVLAAELGVGQVAARVLQAALRYVVPAAIALATAAPLVLSAVGW